MCKYIFAAAVLMILAAAPAALQPDNIPAYTTDNLYIQEHSITTESMNLEWAI